MHQGLRTSASGRSPCATSPGPRSVRPIYDENMKCEIASATALFPRLACLCLLLSAALPLAGAAEAKGASDPVVVHSPDGHLAIELFTRAVSGASSQLQYRVSLSDRAVVDASNLGVRLKDGTELGRDCEVVGSKS